MTFSAYNRPKSALEIGAEIAHDFRPGAVNLVPLAQHYPSQLHIIRTYHELLLHSSDALAA